MREGEQIEAERKERRESYRRSRSGEKRDPALEAVERDIYEGAEPPSDNRPEGSDLPEAGEAGENLDGGGEAAPSADERAGEEKPGDGEPK